MDERINEQLADLNIAKRRLNDINKAIRADQGNDTERRLMAQALIDLDNCIMKLEVIVR